MATKQATQAGTHPADRMASDFGVGATSADTASKLPVVYLPHGGGPWPFVDLPLGQPREKAALADYLRSLAKLTVTAPRAVLVVSAHWEAAVPTVMSAAQPPLLFDYYGFPPEAYQLTWPAPGAPVLAKRVQTLLESAGFQTAEDTARGFDHGTFVPLKVVYPKAEIPVVQLSLKTGLDPEEHLLMGRALAPLREEGVFIVGSGMSYHNLRDIFSGRGDGADAERFDTWLRAAATASAAERNSQLKSWATAPSARAAHPREEHLLPLMVIAGAAGSDRGITAFSETFAGRKISAFHFGA